MKIYLAGPMRGYEKANVSMFRSVAEKLREAGHSVFNPADLDTSKLTLREAMAIDVSWICKYAEAIALLPDFSISLGAMAELALGNTIGIPVQDYRHFLDNKEM